MLMNLGAYLTHCKSPYVEIVSLCRDTKALEGTWCQFLVSESSISEFIDFCRHMAYIWHRQSLSDSLQKTA